MRETIQAIMIVIIMLIAGNATFSNPARHMRLLMLTVGIIGFVACAAVGLMSRAPAATAISASGLFAFLLLWKKKAAPVR